MVYSKTCVRQPPLKLTFVVDVERWLSYKGTCHVILLAKLHDMYLYETDNFFHFNRYLKSVSKVALLHRFYCMSFREHLRTFKQAHPWILGCLTGEEIYFMINLNKFIHIKGQSVKLFSKIKVSFHHIMYFYSFLCVCVGGGGGVLSLRALYLNNFHW